MERSTNFYKVQTEGIPDLLKMWKVVDLNFSSTYAQEKLIGYVLIHNCSGK